MSFRELEQRSYLEISCQILFGDLFLGPDHVQRSCKVFFFLQRTCAEILCRVSYSDLAKRSHFLETLHRDFAKKTSFGDLVQRPCIDVLQRSRQEVAYRDLAWRSLTETCHTDLDEGDLLRISCTWPSTYILTKGSCIGIGASTKILSSRSCTRNLFLRSSQFGQVVESVEYMLAYFSHVLWTVCAFFLGGDTGLVDPDSWDGHPWKNRESIEVWYVFFHGKWRNYPSIFHEKWGYSQKLFMFFSWKIHLEMDDSPV